MSRPLDPDVLSQALVVWTGYGDPAIPAPSRDEQRLIDRFGPELAVEMMPVLRDLEDAFYESDARHVASDLVTMGEIAQRDFARLHPELSDDAVRALAWCYTFDYK